MIIDSGDSVLQIRKKKKNDLSGRAPSKTRSNALMPTAGRNRTKSAAVTDSNADFEEERTSSAFRNEFGPFDLCEACPPQLSEQSEPDGTTTPQTRSFKIAPISSPGLRTTGDLGEDGDLTGSSQDRTREKNWSATTGFREDHVDSRER